jgi:hypothetical protein
MMKFFKGASNDRDNKNKEKEKSTLGLGGDHFARSTLFLFGGTEFSL